MQAPDTIRMTLEEFMTLYSDEGAFELIDGERIAVSPQVTGSGRTTLRLVRWLADYVDEHGLGEIFMEIPFVLPDTYDSNWVIGSRVPDAMFVNKEALDKLKQADPDWLSKPILLVPDLAIEVVSPTDRYSQVNNKVKRYLSDGVRVVWVIDPEEKIVTVHEGGSSQQTYLTVEDSLSGGEVVVGFTVQVNKLFE